LGVSISLAIGILGLFFAKEILALMGAGEGLIEEGYRYTQIMMGGNITVLLLFLINAIFRGAGNASIAMWALVLSNGINLILDPIFSFVCGPVPAYGVTGAAIATNIGRGIAVLFQLWILFLGWGKIKLFLKDLVLDLKVMWNLVRVSLGGIG